MVDGAALEKRSAKAAWVRIPPSPPTALGAPDGRCLRALVAAVTRLRASSPLALVLAPPSPRPPCAPMGQVRRSRVPSTRVARFRRASASARRARTFLGPAFAWASGAPARARARRFNWTLTPRADFELPRPGFQPHVDSRASRCLPGLETKVAVNRALKLAAPASRAGAATNRQSRTTSIAGRGKTLLRGEVA